MKCGVQYTWTHFSILTAEFKSVDEQANFLTLDLGKGEKHYMALCDFCRKVVANFLTLD